MFNIRFDRDQSAASLGAAGSLEPVRVHPWDIGTRSALNEIATGLIGLSRTAGENPVQQFQPANDCSRKQDLFEDIQ